MWRIVEIDLHGDDLSLDLEFTPGSKLTTDLGESLPMNLAGRWTETFTGVGALLLASGTLLCCALPILLVTLGMGTTVAALVGAAPWLVALSHYKGWMFASSAIGLVAASFFLYRPGRSCPTDPRLARLCTIADRWNRRGLTLAAVLWLVGAFAAYLLLPLRQWLDP